MVTVDTQPAAAAADIQTQKNEKKMRRLWKSFSVETSFNGPHGHGDSSSPQTPGGVEEVFPDKKKYGAVLPALKFQLAEQGDKTAQLDLAREILINVNSDGLTDEEVLECEERAMYWLLRAAEQGSSEAVDTIKGMADQGRGVTDQNYVDVMNVCHMTQDQLTASYVGKRMFQLLSNGSDYVTTLQVSRLVQDKVETPRIVLNKSKYSQDDLIDVVSQYFHGDLPQMDLSLKQSCRECLDQFLSLILVLTISLYLYFVISLMISLL